MNHRPNTCSCCQNSRCSSRKIPSASAWCNVHNDNCEKQPVFGGITSQLKRVDETTVFLDDGEPVIFETILTRITTDVTYSKTTGNFCLHKPGSYLVNWDVAVEGSLSQPFIRMALIQDEQVVGASAMPVTVGQISGTSLIAVSEVPVRLMLVNATGEQIRLSEFSPVGNMTITRISNVCL